MLAVRRQVEATLSTRALTFEPGSHCRLPLWGGYRQVGNLLCEMRSDCAERVEAALVDYRQRARIRNELKASVGRISREDKGTLRQLRKLREFVGSNCVHQETWRQ